MSNVKISTFSPYNDNSVGSFQFNGGTLNAVLTDGITAIGTNNYTLECWVYHTSISGQQTYVSDSYGNTNGVYFYKDSSHQLGTYYTGQIATSSITISNKRWYHVAVVRNGTGSGNVKQYINGAEAGSGTDSTNLTDTAFSVGESAVTTSNEMVGYITDVRLVVGSSSSAAIYTSAFTPPTTALTNVSGTGYSTYVLMQPGKNSNLNRDTAAPEEIKYNAFSIAGSDATLSNNNTTIAYGSSGTRSPSLAPFPMSSGKWYWEMIVSASSSTPLNASVGIQSSLSNGTNVYYPGMTFDTYDATQSIGYYLSGSIYYDGLYTSSYSSAVAVDQVVGIAYDADNGAIYFRDSSTWLSSGDPTSGSSATGAAVSGLTGTWFAAHGDGGSSATHTAEYNFGNNGTFNANKTAGGNTDADGNGDFFYAVPDGYRALTKLEPTRRSGLLNAALKPEEHFGTMTYSAHGSSVVQFPHGFSFTPDFLWIKNRTLTDGAHWLYDTVRGFTSYDLTSGRGISTNNTSAEGGDVTLGPIYNESSGPSVANDLSTHITIRDGNSAGIDTYNTNRPGSNYVVWGWKAGGPPVLNTDGTTTSMVSVNQDAGFSIVSYVGTGANATVGHGLAKAPEMVVVRNRAGGDFKIFHSALGAGNQLFLNDASDAQDTSAIWNDTAPTSRVFTVGTNTGTNQSDKKIIAYCWHSVPGFSKIGSFTGNGSTDGPFIYLGFRPAFVLAKANVNGAHWTIHDSTRDPSNVSDSYLFANNNQVEGTTYSKLDFLSNGFKFRSYNDNLNYSSSVTYYLAFAETPSAFTNSR